jgi:hypothetical protein
MVATKIDPYAYRVGRACDACRFYSDQQARIARGKTKSLEAMCLNRDSIHSGKWRREHESCFSFERGDPIDLPKGDAA